MIKDPGCTVGLPQYSGNVDCPHSHVMQEYRWARHTPHWMTPGQSDGYAYLCVQGSLPANPGRSQYPPWCQLDATETSRKGSSKRTMLSLDETQMRALYAQLGEMLGLPTGTQVADTLERCCMALRANGAPNCEAVKEAGALMNRIVAAS